MTQVIKRALPFVMTFVLGVACTAIVRSVLPTHKKSFYSGSRARCEWERGKKVSAGGFVSLERNARTFGVTQIEDSGGTDYFFVTVGANSSSDAIGLTPKEEALVAAGAAGSGRGSSPNSIVSYVSPDTIDGLPATSDARLIDVPLPAFWRDKERWGQAPKCNVIVRVDLDSSGKVSNVQKVRGCADGSYASDILEAAKKITFHPALRHGMPVTQRISLLYTAH